MSRTEKSRPRVTKALLGNALNNHNVALYIKKKKYYLKKCQKHTHKNTSRKKTIMSVHNTNDITVSLVRHRSLTKLL